MNADKNMAEHTKGRMTYEKEGISIAMKAGRELIARTTGVHYDNEANARRLVACWNACQGIDTDLLEKDFDKDHRRITIEVVEREQVIQELLQRETTELIGALRMAEEWLRPSGASKGHKEGWAIKEDHDRICALLAKYAPKVPA